MEIISIESVTKRYKNGRGINNISLTVEKGEIFGFLGANGAGKTTTMKIMTGLISPNFGDVKLFSYSITNNYEKAMANVGTIIENVEVFPYLTAFENLKQSARYYNVESKRIEEVLDITGLLRYRNEKPKNFSLGMRQRLGIANAILHKPKLIILDEPLNGLDVEGMIEMRKLIKRLNDENETTFFISSHLIHDVELTCSRVGILYNGNLTSVDYIKNILKNYSSLENYFVSEVEKNEFVQNNFDK